MKKYLLISVITLIISTFSLFSSQLPSDFTVASYNAGGLPDHYDYLKAAAYQKLMQERYSAEPENMAQFEHLQQLALRILFCEDPILQKRRVHHWEKMGHQKRLEQLTESPTIDTSINYLWFNLVNQMITPYTVRPILIQDEEVINSLDEHLLTMTQGKKGTFQELLLEARTVMAKKIIRENLKFDIINLQEANYLDPSMFPPEYEVKISNNGLKTGIAWNKGRFELIQLIGELNQGKAFAVQLMDKESGKVLVVVSAHLTGSNPIKQIIDPVTGLSDSDKGDRELESILSTLDEYEADIKLIGMDSNVTAFHPRLNHLKIHDYRLDSKHFIEPTNTNPHLLLNTRLDWIAIKTSNNTRTTITNIPVLGVGLNSIKTNMSDHKPIAAKIQYTKQ